MCVFVYVCLCMCVLCVFNSFKALTMRSTVQIIYNSAIIFRLLFKRAAHAPRPPASASRLHRESKLHTPNYSKTLSNCPNCQPGLLWPVGLFALVALVGATELTGGGVGRGAWRVGLKLS